MTGLNQFTTRWTDETKAQAVRLYSNGYSYSQIAAEINITRNAVGGLIKRLGLIKNPTGILQTKLQMMGHIPDLGKRRVKA
jgi:hypothetical protein